MEANKNTTRSFYQNLGKLFYAVAFTDGNINELEIDALKKMVENEWASNDNASYIVDVFNWLNYDQDYSAEECYNSFINFKNDNDNLFTDEIKALILKTANRIAASFSRKNKSELIMLAKLSITFKKSYK